MSDSSQYQSSWQFANQQQYLANPGTQPDYANYAQQPSNVGQAYPPYQLGYPYMPPAPPGQQQPGVASAPSALQPSPPGVTGNASWCAYPTMNQNASFSTPVSYYGSQSYASYAPTTPQTTGFGFGGSPSAVPATPATPTPPPPPPIPVPPFGPGAASSPVPPATVSATQAAGIHSTNGASKPRSELGTHTSTSFGFGKTQKPAYHTIKAGKKSKNSFSQQNPTAPVSNVGTSTGKSNVKEQKQKQPPKEENWPEDLKAYVERSFAAAPDNMQAVEEELRQIITMKMSKQEMWTTDWKKVSLPRACKESDVNHKSTTVSSTSSPERNASEDLDPEQQKREKRRKRFQNDDRTRVPRAGTPMMQEDIEMNNAPIIGTCTNLEKKYFRLTSECDPATVRPLPVLMKTLEFLKNKWANEQDYNYICDQFKSLRQDLTVQRIANDFTVKVYETHARIALENEDLSEFNQCQTQLKKLYKAGLIGHVAEFTAYRLLYFVYMRNRSEIISLIAELTPELKADESIKHALSVRSALATGNYYRFFRLYEDAPLMNGYLMDQFVKRERIEALRGLARAISKPLDFDFFVEALGFKDRDSFIEFLRIHHVEVDVNATVLDAKAMRPDFDRASLMYKTVDIKGQKT